MGTDLFVYDIETRDRPTTDTAVDIVDK